VEKYSARDKSSVLKHPGKAAAATINREISSGDQIAIFG
jgi:hypothetical protein